MLPNPVGIPDCFFECVKFLLHNRDHNVCKEHSEERLRNSSLMLHLSFKTVLISYSPLKIEGEGGVEIITKENVKYIKVGEYYTCKVSDKVFCHLL